MPSLDAFIDGLPKVELHVHIEGSLEPEMLFALAERHGTLLPFATVEEARRAYDFDSLQDFLDVYYQGMNVLRCEQDFYDLAAAYMARIATQNVRHTEIFFDPQAHMSRGIAFQTVLSGITRALNDSERDLGITSKLIMCFLRHLSEEEAFATLKEAAPHKALITGVGLDSSENGHPPAKFERVFAAAREHGFIPVAHAGEEGPPAYVREALDLLAVRRVDHGNRSLEDPDLTARLAAEGIPLTVCPLSNLKLRGVRDMRQHPLKRMLDLGLRATVNSDDPAYFGGYMNENYRAVADALALTQGDLVKLVTNSIEASFLDDAGKQRLRDRLSCYLAKGA
jgi:adenosine deaminase